MLNYLKLKNNMSDKEFVLNRFPDARIVFGASGKPSVMSDGLKYQSKPGNDNIEAWSNAANDIKTLNFPKRFFNDEEVVKYFYPDAQPVEIQQLDVSLVKQWVISGVYVSTSSPTSEGAWVLAAQKCKEQYEFWSKKKWNDL